MDVILKKDTRHPVPLDERDWSGSERGWLGIDADQEHPSTSLRTGVSMTGWVGCGISEVRLLKVKRNLCRFLPSSKIYFIIRNVCIHRIH